MNRLYVPLLVLLAACTKNTDVETRQHPSTNEKPEVCDFGITQFNLTKRSPVDAGGMTFRKKDPRGPAPTTGAVILLDFNGHTVSGTQWNMNGPFDCAPANLTAAEQQIVFDVVTEDFRPFNVFVTTDESVYNAGDPYKRMRVLITETWEWYGQAGGVSFRNSFTWGDNTPCFVFSSLLNYSTRMIAEAASHETGHTFGLRHQASWDANCGLVSGYNHGTGDGEISWSPIMGNSYYRTLGTWHNGAVDIGCGSLQDELLAIGSILGSVADDHQNSATGATSLASSANGIINNENDRDFFSVNLSSSSSIVLSPFSTTANTGQNLDLLLKIYSSDGTLIQTASQATALSAGTTLAPGNYYLSVETEGNPYATKYGMLGKYGLTVSAVQN